MATTYQRRGPKAGSTAIPFMITVLISLVIFGGVGFYFYQKLTLKSKELPTMQTATANISEDDINTILFVLDPDDDTRKNAVMLLHFNPVRKKIFTVGIPVDMQVIFDGKAMTVDTCYINHGMDAMKTAIADALGQPIDRYIKMDSNGFQRTVELIGNVTYRIAVRDTGLKPLEDTDGNEDVEVTLDNEQFETMLTSSKYGREGERCSVIGSSVAALLNQCIGGTDIASTTQNARRSEGGTRVALNLDNYFGQMVDSVTTDITVMDFTEHRHAISYMFQYTSSPANGQGVQYGPNEEGALVPDKQWLDSLKITLAQHSQSSEDDDEDSEETEE